MQINKIYSNMNIQSPLKLETKSNQAENLSCQNYETSIYNQKNVTLPFRGYINYENECVKLLRLARDHKGYRTKFNDTAINQILDILKKEPIALERLFILKEAFCLTDDEINFDNESKVSFYDINGEEITNKFFKDYLKLVTGRDGDDRLALFAFTKFEMDNDATEPIGAFLKLPEDKKQELIPFLRRINNFAMSDFENPEIDRTEYVNSLYDYFRLLVYAIDDLAHTRNTKDRLKIKENLLEVSIQDNSYQEQDYPDERIKQDVLDIINDMNIYILEKIVK